MFEAVHAYYLNLVPRLTRAELDAMDEYLTVRTIARGDYLVKAGQVCRHVSFINKGVGRLFSNFEGKDISVAFFMSGDYASEYESFLTQSPAAFSIDALTDLEVVDLGFSHMQLLYERYPAYQEFGRKIAELLFIYLNQRNTVLLSLGPEDRYRHMIECQPTLIQHVPQYMLASYMGVTPEHLSRIRKKMSQHAS